MVERVAAFVAPVNSRDARGSWARFLMWRDSVDMRNRGAPSKSLATPTSVASGAPPVGVKRRQCAGASEPHQPLDVGDRRGMDLVRSGGIRHGGLDASSGLE